VAFSPDGKVLISGGDVGLCAWDVATGRDLGWFRTRLPATAVRFSADGTTLTAGDNFGAIRQLEAGTGKLLREIKPARDLRFHGIESFLSADGRVLGVYDLSGQVRLWDAATGLVILNQQYRGRSVLCSGALSPDGKLLVVSAEGNRARLIDVATGQELRQIEGPNRAPELRAGITRMRAEAIFGFTFSPDGRFLAGAALDSFCVWEVATGERRYQVKDGQGCLACSPDGNYLACGGADAVRLYEAATGKPVRRFEGHDGIVHALAFAPDGKTLGAALDFSVILWDVATGRRCQPCAGHDSPVCSLAFAPDGTTLASGGGGVNGTLLVWDLKTGKPRCACPGHYAGVRSVAYAPDGKTIATGDGYGGGGTGGLDARIRLWSLPEGRLLRDFHGHINSVTSLAFSPDGRLLASTGHDARTRVWDTATGEQKHQLRGTDSPFRSVAFAPDGKTLVVAGTLGELALWRADSGQKLRDLGTPEDEGHRRVEDAAFFPDGRTLLSHEFTRRWLGAGEVRVWETESGRLLRSWPLLPGSTFNDTFALSPDGETLAATTGDFQAGTVLLWDTTMGKLLLRLRGHSGGMVGALAFSADSKVLASGGRDTTVLLWDVSCARLEHLWSELAGGREKAAWAIKKAAATPGTAIPFLGQRLRQVAALEGRVAGLIADLDDDRFEVRDRATRALERLGPEAGIPLRLALQASPSPEVRGRLEQVLQARKRPGEEPPGYDPQGVALSLAVLEEIDNPAARAVIEELARGPESSVVAREARTAHDRLAKRRPAP
jgi:WD40 repeat protein